MAEPEPWPWSKVPEWVSFGDVSHAAVRLYAVLGRYANPAGECWPSRLTIARHMRGCSERSVDRAIADLVRIGAVTVTKRFTPAGDRTSSLYRLAAAPPQGSLWTTRSEVVHPCREGPALVSPPPAPVAQEREPVNESHERDAAAALVELDAIRRSLSR